VFRCFQRQFSVRLVALSLCLLCFAFALSLSFPQSLVLCVACACVCEEREIQRLRARPRLLCCSTLAFLTLRPDLLARVGDTLWHRLLSCSWLILSLSLLPIRNDTTMSRCVVYLNSPNAGEGKVRTSIHLPSLAVALAPIASVSHGARHARTGDSGAWNDRGAAAAGGQQAQHQRREGLH